MCGVYNIYYNMFISIYELYTFKNLIYSLIDHTFSA